MDPASPNSASGAPRGSRRRDVLAEHIALAVGMVCLMTWGALHIEGVRGARHELERFAVLRAAAAQQLAEPDLSLWDLERIGAWRRASSAPASLPLAVLRIPKIRLEVAVLPGTDDFTLNRAVGHIEHTALPGTDGNSGIAGHREGDRALGRAVPAAVACDQAEHDCRCESCARRPAHSSCDASHVYLGRMIASAGAAI